jgi:hypothetical protein
MPKNVIHISDAEAASDFAAILDRAGAEVIIVRDSRPVAVVRRAEASRGRMLSESIALAEAHAKEWVTNPPWMTNSPLILERSSTAGNPATSGESVGAILKRVQASQGETESGLSAVTIVELTRHIPCQKRRSP